MQTLKFSETEEKRMYMWMSSDESTIVYILWTMVNSLIPRTIIFISLYLGLYSLILQGMYVRNPT